MKISIVTGVWKRPEVFEMFAQGIKNLGVEVDVIVAGSEGKRSRDMVQAHGFYYGEVANQPLASKMNATTLMAKDLKSDYVICMGSDDIISPGLMQEYLKWMELGYDFIGCQDWYFYDVQSGKAMYWGGYRDRLRRYVTCGAGRVISKKLMDRWKWKPWNIGDSAMLDTSMDGRIRGKQKVLNLKALGLYALDIKSKENMTPFEPWDNTKFIDSGIIKREFPYLFENKNDDT